MEFNTNISKTEGGRHEIYGKPLEDLMQNASFTEAIFLLFGGRMPTSGEKSLLDALLVAAVEHGIEAPSIYVPRISVASGNSVHVGMAAGVLAIGDAHGGAGEAAAVMLARSEDAAALVSEYVAAGKRMPGFGHMIYKDVDPRARIIFEKAKAAGLPLAHFEKAYAVEAELEAAKGKKLPLNIDGAFASAALTLGFSPESARALFVIARTAGMGAHAIEEQGQKNGYYRLSQ